MFGGVNLFSSSTHCGTSLAPADAPPGRHPWEVPRAGGITVWYYEATSGFGGWEGWALAPAGVRPVSAIVIRLRLCAIMYSALASAVPPIYLAGSFGLVRFAWV